MVFNPAANRNALIAQQVRRPTLQFNAPRVNVQSPPPRPIGGLPIPLQRTQPVERTVGASPWHDVIAERKMMKKATSVPNEEGNQFGRGLGFLVNNPFTKGALNALSVLDFGRRAAILGAEQTALALPEGLPGIDEDRVRADERSNIEKLRDAEYGFGQIAESTGNQWLDRGLGFLGDVALDPLTYVAGIGFAGKAGTVGGKAARGAAVGRAVDKGYDANKAAEVLSKGFGYADEDLLKLADVEGGIRVGLPFTRGTVIPKTEGLVRPISKGRGAAAAKFNRTRTGKTAMNARAPKGLEQAYRELFGGEGAGNDIPTSLERLMLEEERLLAQGQFQGRAERMTNKVRRQLRGASREQRKKMLTATEKTGESNPFRDALNDLWNMAGEFGINTDRRISRYSPHITTREGRKWLSDNSEIADQVFGIRTQELYQPSGVTMARGLREGTDLNIKGRKFKIDDDSAEGINQKFRQELGIDFDFFETDASVVLDKYINMLAGDVGWASGFTNRIEKGPGDVLRALTDDEKALIGFGEGVDAPLTRLVGSGKRRPGDLARVLGNDPGDVRPDMLAARLDEGATEATNVAAAGQVSEMVDDARTARTTRSEQVLSNVGDGETGASGALRRTFKKQLAQAQQKFRAADRQMERLAGEIEELRDLQPRAAASAAGVQDQLEQMRVMVRDRTRRLDRAFERRLPKEQARRVEQARQRYADLSKEIDELAVAQYTKGAKLAETMREARRAAQAKFDDAMARVAAEVDIEGKTQALQDARIAASEATDMAERARLNKAVDAAAAELEQATLEVSDRTKILRREFDAQMRRYDRASAPRGLAQDIRALMTPEELSALGGWRNISADEAAKRLMSAPPPEMLRVADTRRGVREALEQNISDPTTSELRGRAEMDIRLQQAEPRRVVEEVDRLRQRSIEMGQEEIYLGALARVDQLLAEAPMEMMEMLDESMQGRRAAEELTPLLRRTNQPVTIPGPTKTGAVRRSSERGFKPLRRNESTAEKAKGGPKLRQFIGEQQRITDELYAIAEDGQRYLDVGTYRAVTKLLDDNDRLLRELEGGISTEADLVKLLSRANKNDLARMMYVTIDDNWRSMQKLIDAAGLDGVVMQRDLANQLQSLYTASTQKQFWGVIDTFTNLFKTYATLTPGFHVRNAMSAVFMNSSDNVPVATQAKMAALTWKMGRAAKKGNFDQFLDGLDPIERAAIEGAMGTGMGGFFTERGVGKRGTTSAAVTEWMFENRATDLSKRAGSFVEAAVRLPVVYDTIERGLRAGRPIDELTMEGMQRARRLHFDYSQVSQFDERMKRIIPFWTFMSRNLPLQISQMWTKPRTYAKYNSFVRNFRGEDEPGTPEYFQNIGAFRFGDFDINGMPMYLQPDFAHTRLEEDMMNASDLLSGEDPGRFLTQLNPAFTAPVEYVTGRDLFTGRQYDETDVRTIGYPELPLMPLLELIGNPENASNGQRVYDQKAINMLRAIIPLYDRSVRLGGNFVTGGADEDAANRQIEGIARALGAPVRQLSPQQQQQALRGEVYDSRDEFFRRRAVEQAAAG